MTTNETVTLTRKETMRTLNTLAALQIYLKDLTASMPKEEIENEPQLIKEIDAASRELTNKLFSLNLAPLEEPDTLHRLTYSDICSEIELILNRSISDTTTKVLTAALKDNNNHSYISRVENAAREILAEYNKHPRCLTTDELMELYSTLAEAQEYIAIMRDAALDDETGENELIDRIFDHQETINKIIIERQHSA